MVLLDEISWMGGKDKDFAGQLKVPKGFSVRPILIYSGELEKSILKEDFFDQLICFENFLK